MKGIEYGEIILPDNIYVATGTRCNLWWSTAAVYEEGDRSIYFEVKCDIGITTSRGFTLKAEHSMTGAHTLTVRSRELHTRRVISSRTVMLHVVDAAGGEGKKNILMIGDSRTWHSVTGGQSEKEIGQQGNKTTSSELKHLLDCNKGAEFTFIGTYTSELDGSVKNFAESGWTYAKAISEIEAAGGIVRYIENAAGCEKGTAPDYVTVMFGINDLADWEQNNLDQYEKSRDKIEEIIKNAKKLVDIITSGYPECKIILMLEPSVAGNQDGFAFWGITGNDCQVEWEFALKELRKRIIEEFDGGRYSQNTVLSSGGLWCDRIYGYPYMLLPVSERTSEAVNITLMNCVHPHDNGYRQIADGYFGTVKYLETLK